ncbi:DUF4124 domain-containing protein [Thalassotalea piscium]
MNKLYIGMFFAGVSFFSSATSITIYRWVDGNNVVHFSQQQPEHNDYTELSMSAPAKVQASENEKLTETQAKPAVKVEESKDLCEEAKNNVKTLKAFDKIQYKDTDGKFKVLDDTQKKQQLEINEKQVEVYCQS